MDNRRPFIIPQMAFVITFLLVFITFGAIAAVNPQMVEKCGECHEDAIETKQWRESAHARSIETLTQSGRSRSSCLSCHSADYRMMEAQTRAWGKNTAQRISKGLTEHDPVACSACHRHDSPYENYLILPANQLCESCHQRTKG